MSLSLNNRLKQGVITLILLGLLGGLAWVSTLYKIQTDITLNSSNTLSLVSQKLLATMPDDLHISAYIPKNTSLRLQISQLIDRYRLIKPNLTLDIIDPSSQPEKTRELAIGKEGAVIIDYQGRTERLTYIDEVSLSNALAQLSHAKERWVSFLAGHGERAVSGVANFDLGQFGKELRRHKIQAQDIDLSSTATIPNNSALLVLSSPTVALLAGELDIIKRYIEQGGNLLILTDPDKHYLDVFLTQLGIEALPGTLVDGQSKLYGIDDPSFVVTGQYPNHAITKTLQTLTVYPTVAALIAPLQKNFKAQALLTSGKQSWTETGAIAGKISFDANSVEHQGPLNFAYALTRSLTHGQQRVVVVGDGDFLANTYIGNAGNLDMGLRIVNWLLHDDQYIDIPAKIAVDSSLQLTNLKVAMIGFGFLLVLPLTFLIMGFIIWHRRKRR